MVRALIFHRYRLFHQPSLFELVAVDERSTKAPLLIWREVLGEIGIHLTCSLCVSGKRTVKRRILILVVCVVEVLPLPVLQNGRPSAFFPLSLSATGWVQSCLLLLWLQGSD
jgi:hypothetical protein